jgi:HPt (histidine-containing phosphotransfer) domain-containing protein
VYRIQVNQKTPATPAIDAKGLFRVRFAHNNKGKTTMLPMLDIPHAIEQAGGNPDLAKELFTMLLKELPDQKHKLNQALNDGDEQGLWDNAHKIYGSTAYCGVPALQRAAKELEEAIKAKTSDITDKIEGVNKAIEELLMDGEAALEQEWL